MVLYLKICMLKMCDHCHLFTSKSWVVAKSTKKGWSSQCTNCLQSNTSWCSPTLTSVGMDLPLQHDLVLKWANCVPNLWAAGDTAAVWLLVADQPCGVPSLWWKGAAAPADLLQLGILQSKSGRDRCFLCTCAFCTIFSFLPAWECSQLTARREGGEEPLALLTVKRQSVSREGCLQWSLI